MSKLDNYLIDLFFAILGGGCLNEQAMGDLIKIAISTLNEHFERQAERLKKRNDEDYDEGVEEQLVEEDDEDTYTLSKLGDLVHALFAAYKEAFLPCFEQLLPYATKLLVRNSKNLPNFPNCPYCPTLSIYPKNVHIVQF